MAGPVVVHPLGVLGITHKARDVHTAFDFPFVADDAHDRYPLARPFAFVEDVKTVGFHPHDLLAVYFACADGLAKHRLQVSILWRTFESCLVVWVQVQRSFFVIFVEVFRDADGIFGQPLCHAFIADALRHKSRDRCGVWKHTLIVGFQDVFSNKAPFSVCAAWVLDRRVHIDAKRVTDAHNADVLIEAVFVAILSY